MDIHEIVWVGVDWIDLSEDWDKWQALVNTLKDPLGPTTVLW
jgi:hypothetical protein